MGKTVILLNGETIQSLSMAKALKRSGYTVWSICDDKLSYGFNNKHTDRKVLAPSIHNDPKAFHCFFIDFLKNNHAEVVIPMNDYSAEYLSKNKTELTGLINFIIPDYEVFIKGYDKNKLMKVCAENDLPHPQTFDLSEVSVQEAGKKLRFPALIKPNITTGGRGFARVENSAQLSEKYPVIKAQYGECHVQEFIPAGGRQFKVEIFIDKHGRIINSTVFHKIRFYPENGGSSCCSVSIENKKLVEMCGEVLRIIGWEGFADFDLIEDIRSGEIKIMEINPRVPACVKLSLVSGVDFATNIADASLGFNPKSYAYTPGKILRYMALDTLWFAYSSNRFKTIPKWGKIFGSNVFWQESGGGIKAMLIGSMSGFIKQLNPSFRKAKAGLRSSK